jgi:HEAT repeat protein
MRRCLLLFLICAPVVLEQVQPASAQSAKAAALIKELADKNPTIRRNAAQELGDLADVRITDARTALPALKDALKDTDPAVRQAVLAALGKIEPDKFPALLIDVLKNDKDGAMQIAAVASLGQLAQQGQAARVKDAIPVLIEVYKALATAPPTPVKPPQPNTPPSDPSAVRRAILQTLGQLQPDPKERLAFLTDSLKGEKDNGVRATLINALGQIGPNAKAAVPEILEVQKASLAEAAKITVNPKGPPPDYDPQGVRRAVIQALGRIDPDPKTFVPILDDALKNDKDANVKVVVVTALGQIGPEAKPALPALLDTVKSATAPGDPGNLRRAVVSAVLKIEPEAKELVPVLTGLLRTEKDLGSKLVLINALGDIGAPAKSAAPVLLEVQKASPPQPKGMADPGGIRRAIIDTLAKIQVDAKELVPILVSAMRLDRDVAVRQAAITALANLGPEAKAAVPDLMKLAKSTLAADKEVAKLAESALEKIGK